MSEVLLRKFIHTCPARQDKQSVRGPLAKNLLSVLEKSLPERRSDLSSKSLVPPDLASQQVVSYFCGGSRISQFQQLAQIRPKHSHTHYSGLSSRLPRTLAWIPSRHRRVEAGTSWDPIQNASLVGEEAQRKIGIRLRFLFSDQLPWTIWVGALWFSVGCRLSRDIPPRPIFCKPIGFSNHR